MTLTLKPCPFCGSNKISIQWPIFTDPAGYVVWCNECGCEYHTERDNKEEAIADWNKRADLRSEELGGNARIFTAAPKMYSLIRETASLPDEQCLISDFVIMTCKIITKARKMISRIDGTEDKS